MSSDDDTSSVSSGSTSSCVSTASQSTKPSTSDCRAIRLLPIPLFHPHAYSRAIRTGGVRERAYYDGARSDTEWRDEGFENAMLRRSLIASAAQAPYFERFEGSDGQTYLHRECIIAGFAEGGRLEVARLIVDEVSVRDSPSILPAGADCHAHRSPSSSPQASYLETQQHLMRGTCFRVSCSHPANSALSSLN